MREEPHQLVRLFGGVHHGMTVAVPMRTREDLPATVEFRGERYRRHGRSTAYVHDLTR